MSSLVKQIQYDLQAKATSEFAASQRRFFKEQIKIRGVRSAQALLGRWLWLPM